MSITLGTVSSPVVNGRCMGCGRFIKRTESHFHTKRQKRTRSASTSRPADP